MSIEFHNSIRNATKHLSPEALNRGRSWCCAPNSMFLAASIEELIQGFKDLEQLIELETILSKFGSPGLAHWEPHIITTKNHIRYRLAQRIIHKIQNRVSPESELGLLIKEYKDAVENKS